MANDTYFPVRFSGDPAPVIVQIKHNGEVVTINMPKGHRQVKLPLVKVLEALGDRK